MSVCPHLPFVDTHTHCFACMGHNQHGPQAVSVTIGNHDQACIHSINHRHYQPLTTILSKITNINVSNNHHSWMAHHHAMDAPGNLLAGTGPQRCFGATHAGSRGPSWSSEPETVAAGGLGRLLPAVSAAVFLTSTWTKVGEGVGPKWR